MVLKNGKRVDVELGVPARNKEPEYQEGEMLSYGFRMMNQDVYEEEEDEDTSRWNTEPEFSVTTGRS